MQRLLVLLWLGLGSALACEPSKLGTAEERAVSAKACDLFTAGSDILAVRFATPSLFYVQVSEAIYRGMRQDQVSAEKMAMEMLEQFQALIEPRPRIVFLRRTRRIAEAGYSAFGAEPYFELRP